MSKKFKKCTALAAIFFYLVSGQGLLAHAQSSIVPSSLGGQSSSLSFGDAFSEKVLGTSARRIARAPLMFPASLGVTEEFEPAVSASQLPAILHLQTAHGGYDAQMALARVLNYLKKNQGLDLLLLEGADEQLDPKLDRFFKNNVWNQQVAKERVKKGRMSGAAYFLMRQSEDSVKAFGVESSEDYRVNRSDFLKLIEQRETLEEFLRKTESDLDRLFAQQASKKILDLRRQEKSFMEGRLDWASWIGELKKIALVELKLDLEHASSQKEWPSLLRFLWLRSMELPLQTSAAPVVQSVPPDSLKPLLRLAQGRSDNFHYGEVRIMLEEWLRHKKTRTTEPLPAELHEALKRVTLQNEIKPAELWTETDALTRRMMNFYAKTPVEKKLLKLDEDLKLLHGLLLAELSYEEYQQVLQRGEALVPSGLISAIQSLSQINLSLVSAGQDEAAEKTGGDSAPDSLFEAAIRFYSGAKKREKKIAEKAIQLAEQSHAKWVVLVTGGFHSSGLRDEFVREGMTYMRVTPRTRPEQGDYLSTVSQDPRAVYRQVFKEHSLGGETRAQIEDAAVLPISRAAVGRLGIDEAGFIENRTKVLTAWLATAEHANAAEVITQFNESAFSQQYDLQWSGSEKRSAFARSEVRADPSAVDLHKQIYAELHVIEEILSQLPQGAISEFSRIQALLAALYGGSVQLSVEQLTKKKTGRSHWIKRNYDFRWGLYALAEKSNLKKMPTDQRKKIKTEMQRAVDQLEQFGIRVGQGFSSFVAGEEVSVGAVLTHEPAFQNPFLQTFLGESDKMKSASQSQSRFERAVEILSAYPAVKERKLTSAEISYLRSFDNIFIPNFKMGKETPFVVRVQHNRVRGPYKGGIRLVDAYTLVHDKHFKKLFDDLKTNFTLQELRYFLRKYILEETLPLSFGMTSKAAVANLPYGGGKGTMLVADVIETSSGERRIEDLHRGHDATRYLFQLARGTARVLAESDTVRSDHDIPAADLNSGRYMDAMADEQIEEVYEAIQPKLAEVLKKRRAHLPPGDVAFIELLAEVPQYTSESVEKPLYLQLLTDYGNQLRLSKRRVPSWAKPLFEAAAAYTSKSEKLMGSVFRTESTGYGGIHVLKDIVVREKLGRSEEKPLLGMTAKLMGLGAVGAPAAEKMVDEGMVIKLISLGPLGAVSKKEGGFTMEEITLIRRMIAEKKDLVILGKKGYEAPGLEYIEPEQVDSRLLEAEADVFVLAAVENAIHVGNVGQAKAKIFLELANGAITNAAYDRLVQDANTRVIPDTLANAGGVTVSYYEWLQNLKNESWNRGAIIQRLEKQLSGGVARVARVRETYHTDWRTAADILMILEVLAARRAEKSKPVRSKNKRSEVRVDTDVSTHASNFRTRRSEVRAVHDQIGGFSYLDEIKNGKIGVFSAREIVKQVTDHLLSSEADAVFAAAVLTKAEDSADPDFMTWQSIVNEQGEMDSQSIQWFLRQKIQPLGLRAETSFEMRQFLYTVKDDEVELIKRLGGHKTGLLLAVFPEKNGGNPDAPGGRGERPWDQPKPFSPQSGQALKAASQPIEPASLFGGERETADLEALVTSKKAQARSEVRAEEANLISLNLSAAEFERNPFPAFPQLTDWFSQQRWFMEKGKDILGVEYVDAFIFGEENGSAVHGVIARFRFTDSEGLAFNKQYFIPVIVSQEPLLNTDPKEFVNVQLVDGIRTLSLAEHQTLYQKLLTHFYQNGQSIPTWNQGRIVFTSLDETIASLNPAELQAQTLGVSTSNVLTQVTASGQTVISKTYKDLRGASGRSDLVWPPNEELPKYAALSRSGYPNMPALHTSMNYVSAVGEKTTLGVMMEALDVETDAGGIFWNGVAQLVKDLKEKTDSNAGGISVAPFTNTAAFARELAGTVAGMHAAFLQSGEPGFSAVLANDQDRLKWQEFTGHHLEDALAALRARASKDEGSEVLKQLLEKLEGRHLELVSAEHVLDPMSLAVMKAPVHGDLSTAQGLIVKDSGESLTGRLIQAAETGQTETIRAAAQTLAEHVRWLDFEGPPAKDLVSPSNDSRENWFKDVAGILGGFWYIANLQLFNYLGLDPQNKPEDREAARTASLVLAGQVDISALGQFGLKVEIINVLNQWVSETTEAFLEGYFSAVEKDGIENAILTHWDRQTARSLVDYFLFERAAHEFYYEFYARNWGWEGIPSGRILQLLDSGRLTQTSFETATDQQSVQTAFGGAFESTAQLPPREFFSPVDAGLPVDGVFLPFHHLRHADDWGVGNFYTAKLAGDFLHAMNYRVTQDLPYTYSSAGNSPYSVLSGLLLDPEYVSALEAARMMERSGIPAAGWAQFLSDHAEQIKKLKESPDVLHQEIRDLNAQAMGVLWVEFQKHPESALARELQKFLDTHKEMVEDDLLFLQLAREFGGNWRRWPKGVRERQAEVLDAERERLKPALRFEAFVQFVLDRQRQERDATYKKLGISTMVDMAIAPPDVEVWKNPAAVGMSYENGLIRSVVQGVPGKKEARVGQLWNFSVYQWLKPEAHELFLKIFKTNLERADYLRIDQTLAIYRIFGFLSQGLSLKALGIFDEVQAIRQYALAEGTPEAKQNASREVTDLIRKNVRAKAVGLGWPEEAVQLLFEESGQVRSNGNLIMIARKTPTELRDTPIATGMPWQRWHWEEDDFLQGEPKWDVLRLTPNQRAQDDGFTETWLFPEDGGAAPQEDDEIRAGYFMPSPGEAMMLELARIAQEKGKVLILETLGAVTPEIQKSSAHFGNNYFPVVYAMGDPSSWYYPPNFKSASGMVTFNVADTGSLQGAWQSMKNWDIKGALVRSFFPNLPGEQFQPHMLNVTPEVHQKLLEMVYAPWKNFPSLDPAKVPLIALLGLIDLANLPENYRLNIPGQQGQWINKLPADLSLENLQAAAQGQPSSEAAALVVRSVRQLQRERELAYAPVNPADVKILRVKPDVNESGILMRKLHPEGAARTEPFLIEASVQGMPRRMEVVLQSDKGMQARFTMQERRPENGEMKGVLVWALGLKPSRPGAYDFWIEITKPDGTIAASNHGRLVTVHADEELNPLSPQYALTPDGRQLLARSDVSTLASDFGTRRSEVRATPSKLAPEEITAARTEEFFAIRDELLAIFSRYKKAKGAGKEAEQTRLLADARRYANILPSFIDEIRSGDVEEQKILDRYASMVGKARQSEAKTLGESMRSLTPRFVKQWQIYNRKGALEADKQTANTALNRLNAEVVRLAKRRLKLQLLQFKEALQADPMHQGTIFALLMSITDLYQRIRYEYQWRTFRSAGSIKTARLPMMGALGLVRDNLSYQSEPLLRVESREQGGVTISQIVWKFKPVQGSFPALIPEMTGMTFPDFTAALRGKEHALESQEQDYAALADHDFILQGVKDTLDWYVKSRETIPEETRDQLIATLMAVQTGPNGRFGLARRRARHYTPGARKVQANVLEKPGPKVSLAITNIETGTVEKLKEASGAIEAAQLWTRARREYIERITAPATQRKRDYAYALMRDALIRDALNMIKTDVTDAVVSGRQPLLEKTRAAEQNLRGLEQTYFRFIAQGGFTEPEIILYKNLQRELRGMISVLAGLNSDIAKPTLPRSAKPTAEALDRKIKGAFTMLTAAAQRRETSLSRSEVRSSPSETVNVLSQDIGQLQTDLRAAIESAESQVESEEPLTAVDDPYGVFQGTSIAPSDETVPLIHPGVMDDFLERQKAVVFYFELYEQSEEAKDAYVQEFRISLALIESQVERLQSFLGRSEVRAGSNELSYRIEAAEFLGGLFLPDDLDEWALSQTMPASAARYLETPRARGDIEAVLEKTVQLMAAFQRNAWEWMDRFPGETLRDQEKKTYLIGPELVQRYGPVLLAVEQAAPTAARFIVMAENAERAIELEKLVNPINTRLPKNRRLMIKTPEQARGLLKADTLRGLGLGEADAALLRKMIPDYVPLNVFELDAWVSQVPGLTALVQQFHALAALSASA